MPKAAPSLLQADQKSRPSSDLTRKAACNYFSGNTVNLCIRRELYMAQAEYKFLYIQYDAGITDEW